MDRASARMRDQCFLFAIKNQNIGRIETLLNQNYSANNCSNECQNTLDLAIELENLQIVSLLIDQGANTNSPIEPIKKQIALHRAVIRGNREIILKVLQHTATPSATDIDGASVLHLANEIKSQDKVIEIMKIFLDLGMDVELRNHKGETPLFVAGKHKKKEVIEFLLERGADLYKRDCNGNSLIQYLLKETKNNEAHKEYFIDWLLSKGTDVHCIDNTRESPVQLASRIRLGNTTNNNGNTAFHMAIKRKKWFAIPKLLEQLDDVNARNNNQGQTPLHVMIDSGDSSQGGFVNDLLSKGVDIEIRDNNGYTPLHVALQTNSKYMVKKLIELGADVNAEVPGTSVLHLAVNCGVDIVRTLVRAGTYFDVVDDYGFPPLHYATKLDYDVLAYLLEAGADVNGIYIADDLRSLVACTSFRRCMAKFAHANLHVPRLFGSASNYTVDNPGFRHESYGLGFEFHIGCRHEVRKMKNLDIGNQTSLYEFLQSNLRRSVHWLGLDKLQDVMELPNLELNFPLYCDIIKGKHLQAIERKAVLESAESALRQIANVEVPISCLENIFSHLNNPSLRAVIKAANLRIDSRCKR